MKIFSKYIMLPIFGISLLFSSCYKDLSSTDYVEIADVKISVPAVVDGAYACDPDAHVVMDSELEFLNNSKESDFDYEWVLIPKTLGFDDDNGYEHKIVVCTTKNLDFIAKQAARDYTMFFNVIHKATKLKSSHNFSFTISMIKGWMVMDENAAGEGDVSVIYSKALVPEYPESKSGVVMNYFSNSNGVKIKNGSFLSKRTHSANDHVYVFSTDGGSRLKSGTGLIDANYGQCFLTPPTKQAPKAHFYPNGMSSKMEILINDENVYFVKWNMMGAKPPFTTTLFTSESTPATALPIIAPIFPINGVSNTAVLYNPHDNGNFFQITTNAGYTRMADETGPFNPANINPTTATQFELVYMDRGKDDLTYALMRDKKQNGGNNLWLFKADFRTAPVAPATIAKEKTDISTYSGILAAKYFVIGLRGEYMYYADDTQVTHVALTTSATTPIFTAGAGEKIVFMKLYTLYNSENTGRFLFVATYNETAQTGKVHMVELEVIGGKQEPGTTIVEYPGFNRVKDMFLKN